MAVVIAMLRGVNVGGNNKLSMVALRDLCGQLGFRGAQTYIQSGNLVFHDDSADTQGAAQRLQAAIHREFAFKPAIVLRTMAELQKVRARNPFAGRQDVLPNKLLVLFLATAPAKDAHAQMLTLPAAPEEMHLKGSELYIYYPEGISRLTIPLTRIEKMLRCTTTGRNWNTVNKLLAMAEALETTAASQ